MKNHLINKELTLTIEQSGLRLDQALAELIPEYSRTCIKNWIDEKQITVNGSECKPKQKVFGGENVLINAKLEIFGNDEPEDLPLNIVFEDDCLIVINKKVGMVTHPAAGNYSGTLVNALLHHIPDLETLPRAGLIHRIDKNTSGLLIAAKNLETYNYLVKRMQQHKIKREYQAIVEGVLTGGGSVDLPIGRSSRDRKKMAIVETGKAAVTHYRVLDRYLSHSLIHVWLETGRTHQIRVHMSHLNHVIVGDFEYGYRAKLPKQASDELIYALRNFKRQALHAFRLTIIHPKTKEPQTFEADIPEDMKQLIEILKK